jgi:hypothetical protein
LRKRAYLLRAPFAAQPRETAFLERDVKALLQVFVKLNANPTATLAQAGGATLR